MNEVKLLKLQLAEIPLFVPVNYIAQSLDTFTGFYSLLDGTRSIMVQHQGRAILALNMGFEFPDNHRLMILNNVGFGPNIGIIYDSILDIVSIDKQSDEYRKLESFYQQMMTALDMTIIDASVEANLGFAEPKTKYGFKSMFTKFHGANPN